MRGRDEQKDSSRRLAAAATAAAPRPNRAPGALALAALLAAALASSCNFSDQFADYRDEGVNFIAARDFSPTNIDLTDIGFETPAHWTWAWRGSDDVTYNYMTFLPGAAIGMHPSELSASAPVYCLKLVDLVADTEDFEDYTDENGLEAGPWVASPADCNRMSIVSSSTNINGDSLFINLLDSVEWVSFNLASLASLNSTTGPRSYTLLMNSASETPSFKYLVASAFNASSLSFFPSPARINVTLEDGDTQDLFFGTASLDSAVLDDLRAYRSDLAGDSCLRIMLRPADTEPVLADGFYEFTLWIRKPLGYLFSVGDAAAEKPYASRYVTLRMSNLRNGQGVAGDRFSVNGDGQWQQIVLRQSDNFEGIAKGEDLAIELAIFPFDTASPEPGAVEIAQPELHFYLGGY